MRVIVDSRSSILSADPALWAISELEAWITSHAALAEPAELHVLGPDSPGADAILGDLTDPEAFVLTQDETGITAIVAGTDARGVAYGVLEILDRLAYTGSVGSLAPAEVSVPTNRVRSILRPYVSRVVDEEWLRSRTFWDDYLTELATQRFNRVQLALGIGVEYGHDPDVTENYLLFAYPFLVDVPGFDVHVAGLDPAERAANLDALRSASSAAARRGIDFYVGFWCHGTALDDGLEGEWLIEGITPDNHADYCARALETVLRECPDIAGVTLRVHYESGVPEPADAFWRGMFDAIARVDRDVAVDMHSKGLSAASIESAQDAGLRVSVSTKFLAEHLGLPYHQTAIRESELPIEASDADYASITRASRRFTRYGYADYLRRDRTYDVVFRHWPGTQRILLWGDPVFAAGYSRVASFGGGDGAEFFEPLAYVGRKGSGAPGARQPYADERLAEGAAEWRKYRYTYRLLGRTLYAPDANPDQWRRLLVAEHGRAADAAERSLAAASRLLPLVSVAHGVSAANSVYWPEMYENLPIADGGAPNGYYRSDSRPPHTFGSAASLDPEVFATIAESVDELVGAAPSGRLTTFDVARALDDHVARALAALDEFVELSGPDTEAAADRIIIDARALTHLGAFFARKLRAGFAYELFSRDRCASYLDAAIAEYELAVAEWSALAKTTAVYKSDLPFGKAPHLRGHWSDRLPSVMQDLRALRIERSLVSDVGVAAYDLAELARAPRPEPPELTIDLPDTFATGDEILARVRVADPRLRIAVHHRAANQRESFERVEASVEGGDHVVLIPGDASREHFDELVFVEVADSAGHVWRLPTLGDDLATQPYLVVRNVLADRPRRTAAG